MLSTISTPVAVLAVRLPAQRAIAQRFSALARRAHATMPSAVCSWEQSRHRSTVDNGSKRIIRNVVIAAPTGSRCDQPRLHFNSTRPATAGR